MLNLNQKTCAGKACDVFKVSSRVEVSAQWFAVPHVLGTSSAQVRPLHHKVSKPVQTDTDGERGDETVKPSQDDTQRPAQNQQNHQPDDGPETRATRGHSQLQRLKKNTRGLHSLRFHDKMSARFAFLEKSKGS